MVNTRALPIVLLPGLHGTRELLKDLSDQLSLHRTTRPLDYPRDQRFAYAELAAFVRTCVPDCPYVILGESFSGPIAIEIAATDSRVRGLVLASSFARHPLPAQLAFFGGFAAWTPKWIVAKALLGRGAAPDIKAQLSGTLADFLREREVVSTRVKELLRVDKRDRLEQVKCPVLCLRGRRDWLVRRKSVEVIANAIPNCEVHLLDASHMVLTTHAEVAACLINRFCRGLEA